MACPCAVQIGTANYMAPEIWKRQCQTVKADIFSLGAALYELCMLRHLFTGATEDEVQRRIEGFTAAHAAAAAAELLPHYSLELAGLLESMLQVGRAGGGVVSWAGSLCKAHLLLDSSTHFKYRIYLVIRFHPPHRRLTVTCGPPPPRYWNGTARRSGLQRCRGRRAMRAPAQCWKLASRRARHVYFRYCPQCSSQTTCSS